MSCLQPTPPASPPAPHLLVHSSWATQRHHILPTPLATVLELSFEILIPELLERLALSPPLGLIVTPSGDLPQEVPGGSFALAFLYSSAMFVSCIVLHGLLIFACLISRQDSKLFEGEDHVCLVTTRQRLTHSKRSW